MHWRKKFVQSSLIFVSEKLTVEVIEQRKLNSACLVLTLALGAVPYVQSAELNNSYSFNIP